MLYVAVIIAMVSLVAHDWLLKHGGDQVTANTMMVNIIVMSKIFYLFTIEALPWFYLKFSLLIKWFSSL